jgi:hypothetical protein
MYGSGERVAIRFANVFGAYIRFARALARIEDGIWNRNPTMSDMHSPAKRLATAAGSRAVERLSHRSPCGLT